MNILSTHTAKWIAWVGVALFGTFILWLVYCAAMTMVIFPRDMSTDTKEIWAMRGQFGDMFGAFSCILTILTLGFAIYSIYQSARQLDHRNQCNKWEANYTYLLNAKKYLAEDGSILELHGLPKNICQNVGVTEKQVVYVLIDLEAAELFYRINGSGRIEPTEYRKFLLRQPVYRKIVKEIILPGMMLGESEFTRFVEDSVNHQSA